MSSLGVAFIDQVGRQPGGAEQTLATFLKHAPADIVPLVVLFEDGAFARSLRSLGLPVVVVAVDASISESTRERPQLAGALAMLATALRIARLLRERNIDLVYTNSMKAHFIGSLAARLAHLPCIMHFHDLIAGLGLAALRLAARANARASVACSQVVAHAIGVAETRVIYAPIEPGAYLGLPARSEASARLGIPHDLPLVAIVGRINRWKGHDRFVRIAARVNAEEPVRFVIAGAPVFRDADFVPELHALVRELDLADRVRFIPWLDDVRDVYASIDLNANCSTREPFGRTIVEAAAAGVPSICFNDSGAAETIVDGTTGRVVPAGDEAAFARAILAYVRAPERMERDGAAARALAIRFDAARIAAEMAGVMRRACA